MNQLINKGLKTVLVCLFILTAINGCKDVNNSSIPYIYVDININPSNIIELNIPGGSFYYANPGFGGIILFRDLSTESNPYLAFDAACPYEKSSTCRVKATYASGVVKCPCCKTEFILFGGNGSPTKGPATEPLKQYRTYYTGGLINIRN